jgi:AraC-like DNA-binding protein
VLAAELFSQRFSRALLSMKASVEKVESLRILRSAQLDGASVLLLDLTHPLLDQRCAWESDLANTTVPVVVLLSANRPAFDRLAAIAAVRAPSGIVCNDLADSVVDLCQQVSSAMLSMLTRAMVARLCVGASGPLKGIEKAVQLLAADPRQYRTVDDLVAVTGISRRSLDRCFARAGFRTSRLIRSLRVARVIEGLRTGRSRKVSLWHAGYAEAARFKTHFEHIFIGMSIEAVVNMPDADLAQLLLTRSRETQGLSSASM